MPFAWGYTGIKQQSRDLDAGISYAESHTASSATQTLGSLRVGQLDDDDDDKTGFLNVITWKACVPSMSIGLIHEFIKF